ncbi:type IV pili twitching motility protein PilT [Halioglobus sp. HI00S01]|nr:type IV pili twitching motility protein PilT [Halioglobus sp. HI00S01]
MDYKSFLDGLLTLLASKGGSDLFLTTGNQPTGKFDGVFKKMSDRKLLPGQVAGIAQSILDRVQRDEFEETLEANLAYSMQGVGRFRINCFVQRNEVAMVCRNIVTNIPTWQSLRLPKVLPEIMLRKRGLILFVGATGSGKSTSLAALIDHRNETQQGHIITIEDPVEYVHNHKKSIVNQREVGVDTRNWHNALKNTLRQAPDVILIGEIRDRETMEHAIAFAETGHLCISTLHANNANQALDRIINFFPEDRRAQLLLDLSLNIQAFVSQRLIPTIDQKRVAAIEVMLGTSYIRDLIKKGAIGEIKEAMMKNSDNGMVTFDDAVTKLYEEGLISEAEAVKNADSQNDVRLKIKMINQKRGLEPSETVPVQMDKDRVDAIISEGEKSRSGPPSSRAIFGTPEERKKASNPGGLSLMDEDT